jgi:hypothetical protein
MCQSCSTCSHLYHKPRLLSRYAFASAVFGVLAGLEHLPVPAVQARPGLRQEVDHGWQGSLRPSAQEYRTVIRGTSCLRWDFTTEPLAVGTAAQIRVSLWTCRCLRDMSPTLEPLALNGDNITHTTIGIERVGEGPRQEFRYPIAHRRPYQHHRLVSCGVQFRQERCQWLVREVPLRMGGNAFLARLDGGNR